VVVFEEVETADISKTGDESAKVVVIVTGMRREFRKAGREPERNYLREISNEG
jgi:hypothetical protein